MSTPEETPLEQTSSDAAHSTYEAYVEEEESNPPNGPATVQTRGLPDSGGTAKKSSAKASTSTAASS